MKYQKGFTLVEVLIYAATLATTAGLLTAILGNTLRVNNREANSTELSQQLNFVLATVQSLVNESALIESVYETGSPGVVCSEFCTLKLRMTASDTDPTFVHATSDGAGVYLTQNEETPNTNNNLLVGTGVTVDHFQFTKYEFEGGHASVKVDMAFTIDSANPQFAVTRSIQSAIGRVTAAVFDDHLLPNNDATWDVGQVTGNKRWQDGAFSRNVTIGGNVGIGTTTTNEILTVSGKMSLAEGTAPSLTAGYGKIYANSADSGLYFLNDAGASYPLSLTAGRSLTFTNAILDVDSELYTDTKCIWFSYPTAVDDFKSIWTANGFAATLTKMWCESDQTVNADLQVDDGTPADVDGTDLVCDATPPEDEILGGDPTMADGDRLDLAITSVSGSPTWLSLCWSFVYDE